jgi:hypothetical protein
MKLRAGDWIQVRFQEGRPLMDNHNDTHYINICSTSESLTTLTKFHKFWDDTIGLPLVVLGWAMVYVRACWGFLYVQNHLPFAARISFTKLSQAFLVLALATLPNEGLRM